ncbi:Hypothetical protein, conserved [Brucella abortus str. 2308 A]|uniref:Uncharacterized protein n=3 Tax=Brucella TaxID=234 RepID=A0A0H3AQB3_BRUO2|nr:hypothetical protein BOV_0972 [Brucella ovis ATCC 25840]ACU47987.1 hypothetical protein BMI_I1007 [Brucella microti CCM 4915]AEK54321.1 hypothetical protein BPI_I1045 [Brucella pinnipedialis B2/94]EEH14533.1 Hypothetical protein, conserved [Brucella ceti str. Cudo]EEP64477.1 Hypothetical protein, conserved [Brucella abortus str. 2308 A]
MAKKKIFYLHFSNWHSLCFSIDEAGTMLISEEERRPFSDEKDRSHY